ncbi:glycosyltransferase [Streptomyces sp. NPDC001404]|uniref:glycosyltransferase n=1 Tax=Streptomyces sp. NPDC001404 TaxID=3364571 RepID=UPI0036834C21
MKILVMAAGSRGDVAPYTGLGAALRAAGHEVVLAAPAGFAGAVRDGGLGFRPLPDAATGAGGSLLGRAAAYVDALGDGVADAVADGDAELLVLSATTAPLGWHAAEALGVPSLGAYLQPVAPTGDFPPTVGGAGRPLGRWGNRAAGRLSLRVVDRLHAQAVRRLRARLGLPPGHGPRAERARRERAGWPVLHGYSPALLPRPADWREGLDVVGNWWPHVPSGLPAGLEDFLQAGPPPVFVGFGSMGAAAEGLGGLVAGALRRAGVRGVVQLPDVPSGDDLFAVGDVPHALLFPRTAAVVHHAGAGTTAAALRAGVPAVPVPVTADQPFWARRVAGVGAAVAPVSRAGLSVERLADAVRSAVGGPGYRAAAVALSRRMAEEDGAGRVRDAVERLAP